MTERQRNYHKKQIEKTLSKKATFLYFVFDEKHRKLKEENQERIIKDFVKKQSIFYYIATVKKGHFCAILAPNYENLIYLKPFIKYGFVKREKITNQNKDLFINKSIKIISSRKRKKETINPYINELTQIITFYDIAKENDYLISNRNFNNKPIKKTISDEETNLIKLMQKIYQNK